MSRIKRRHFLQVAGSALGAIGWSQLDIQRQGLRYAQVLAQNTPRKLALLVGINNYPDAPLDGCITDVELQKELLIHRFGFNPNDILTLTDDTPTKPTREGILQAFEEHLIKQAKPGDVVVYHYSGHGAQVIDPTSGFSDNKNGTFVPLDRLEEKENDQLLVSDIMGATLFLLMSALDTENVTVVLDSCFSGGGKRGNLKIRSIASGNVYPNPAERTYQEQWLSRLNLSLEEYQKRRQESIAKGVVIASARRDQLAADTPFDGFYAGAFTYILTQYLWQETGDRGIENVLANVSRSTTKISSTAQIPELEVKQGSGNQNKPAYLLEKITPPAEAVVSQVQGDRVRFWLGGLDPQAFPAFNRGAVFTVLDDNGQEIGQVQSVSRDGLFGEGKLLESRSNIDTGALLQERARAIPDDLTLRIGLDDSLGGDAAAARQELSQIDRIELAPLGQGEVQYILGRMTESLASELRANNTPDIPPVDSIGLYGQGLDLIPGSFGATGESIGEAMTRLKPKLRSLLAARIIKLTLNADSSRMKVVASMKVQDREVVASAFTARGFDKSPGNPAPTATPVRMENGIALLPLGTSVQLQVKNEEDRTLYVTVLAIDPEGGMAVVFPNTWTSGVEAAEIKAGETKLIPDPSQDAFKLTVSPPLGSVEVLVIASVSPLREALKALQSIAGNQSRGPVGLGEEPTDVVDRLLGDLNAGSRGGLTASFDPNSRAVDTSKLGAMSISFRSVP